ncbi:hypothetical protein CVIRNUC_010820 [Coccomyxa viridis]|uniref:Sialate O-acetylesterase domain-containing protein n=1 Tax=Coccomyxa viridis TaxID=1274662 RepID=A0AAV1IK05_9CHLO|nr:hypothetical protein CVIRNUC_010820 [Coccomyxa viridis]
MEPHPLPYRVFVLAGQSNMAGRGGVQNLSDGSKEWDGVMPLDCRGSGIQCWDASSRWRRAAEPLHAGIDTGKTCGVGPGMYFASRLLELKAYRPECKIGLVPCAIGGSSITEWQPGSRNYVQMVQRTLAALAASPEGSELEALLWYQGESDAASLQQVREYASKLTKVFSTFRNDIQCLQLPIIQVAITCSSTKKAPYWQQINDIQRGDEIIGEAVYTIDARGLALQADGLHLTCEAQVWVGRQLANTFMEKGLKS